MSYIAGTISVANGSTSVTGVGTHFVANVSVGQFIIIGGKVNQISAIVSDTALSLATPYTGASVTNVSYVIDPSPKPTTIPDMTGATPTVIGSHGLVPAPGAGQDQLFLRGDGSWATAAAPVMTGANGTTSGTAGLVPAPGAYQNKRFLRGDAQWVDLSQMTMIGAVRGGSLGSAGTVPAGSVDAVADKVLYGDATFGIPNRLVCATVAPTVDGPLTSDPTQLRDYGVLIVSGSPNLTLSLPNPADPGVDRIVHIQNGSPSGPVRIQGLSIPPGCFTSFLWDSLNTQWVALSASSTRRAYLGLNDQSTGGEIGTVANLTQFSVWAINQTTAGQVMTFPFPSDISVSYEISVVNTGTASFTMYGKTLAHNTAAKFIFQYPAYWLAFS